jgi:hypothetical protein
MTRLILTATAALAGLFFGLQPAKAQAPWRTVISLGPGTVY